MALKALQHLAEVAQPETCFPARCERRPSLARAGAALCPCVYIQTVLLPPDTLTARTASRWAMVRKHPLLAAATVCSAPCWTKTCKTHRHFGHGRPPVPPSCTLPRAPGSGDTTQPSVPLPCKTIQLAQVCQDAQVTKTTYLHEASPSHTSLR